MNRNSARQNSFITALFVVTVVAVLSIGTAAAAPMTPEKVFGIEFTLHPNNTVGPATVTVVEDEPVKLPGKGGGPYRFTALDRNGTPLYYFDTYISFVRAAAYHGPIGPGPVELIVRLPYGEEVTAIRLEHAGEEVTTFYLPAHLCPSTPDDVCSAYCAGSGVDPDCTSGSLLDPVTRNPVLTAVMLLVAALLAGGGYYAWKRRNKYGDQASRPRSEPRNTRRRRPSRQPRQHRPRRRRRDR